MSIAAAALRTVDSGTAVEGKPMRGERAVEVIAIVGSVLVAVVFVAARRPNPVGLCVLAASAGILAAGAAGRLSEAAERWVGRHRVSLLALAAAVATLHQVHAQWDAWRSFALGYADFGYFTTELEYALPWSSAANRFFDTRMGYHAVFLFYLLTPLYAIFRSPVFLMVVGPASLNLAAFAFSRIAARCGSSAIAGLFTGLAWLALPSLSLLPTSMGYGFQSIYLAVPWLAFAIAFGVEGRWRRSHACLVAAVACEETVCGVAVGWGIFLALFTERRRDGVVVAAMALAYLALTSVLIIPHFADAGAYTRLHLFGALRPDTIAARLDRPETLLYPLFLVAPFLVTALRSPALALAALPTLSLVLLLEDPEYLSLHFWHQSSMLPFLFGAAALGVTRKASSGRGTGLGSAACARALALLTSVLVMHAWLGGSAVSQSHSAGRGSPALRSEDPRLALVASLRERYPPESTRILATERIAAHFTDYAVVHPASRLLTHPNLEWPPLLVLDRSDQMDSMVLEGWWSSVLEAARTSGYATVLRRGSILVLARPDDGSMLRPRLIAPSSRRQP